MTRNKTPLFTDSLEIDLAAGKITDAEWHARVANVITPAYLKGEDPRAGSGYSGTAEHWERARSLVLDGVDKDGSFLDVGCANGHLMESLEVWANAKGISLELYGLDIAPELVELTKRRLPKYAERIYFGNAATWMPPRKFDFVRAGLEYVPLVKRHDFVAHLLGNFVASKGRLILGTFNEERDDQKTAPSILEILEGMGFAIQGHTERPHRSDPGFQYKVLWMCN